MSGYDESDLGEPITGTSMLLIAGAIGGLAWFLIRGAGKKVWFGQADGSIFGKADTIIAISSSESGARRQSMEWIRIVTAFFREDEPDKPIPKSQFRVFKNKMEAIGDSVDAWVVWVRPKGSSVWVPFIFFSSKPGLGGDSGEKEADASMIEFRDMEASGKLPKVLVGGSVKKTKERIPLRFKNQLEGLAGLLLR
jgi:hypothetical protein